MRQLRRLVLMAVCSTLVVASPTRSLAREGVTQQVHEARQEGSVWTAFAFNRHLSPFSLNVDVEGSVATLTGTVENEVKRELAEQVALGIDGIETVDNRIRVDPGVRPRLVSVAAVDERLDDATVEARVKSKLLWNTRTEGLDIGVESREGLVTLSGESASAQARELAGKLAASTEGVERVDNAIRVTGEPGTVARAQSEVAQAGNLLGDAWITGRVKTRFLSSDNLGALDISVRTDEGVVHLAGTVATAAEKELAVETARNVRGVLDVQAASLKVAG
ncbi:transporter [Pseudomonas sp. Pc102]|uniref:BON domain-containing protein n=1 Tax=Pseudomonas sp. Pc102 TaxID=2678261 RepID=UPI001BCD9D90|nr:BON domain-containing protein [Pseudomonas sp. Pc102]BBP80466.1 transporter [Pseudomonas sp. Pc102]